MRVLVTGGRDFNDRDLIWRTLDRQCGEVSEDHPLGTILITLIHGACPTGADHHADEWATCYGTPCVSFAADWKSDGKAAGPIRNQRMLDQGKPDLVLAFPGGRGTADMVRRARAAGVSVVEVARVHGPVPES